MADLEGLGYVERVPDPDDGRAKIIRLTPHGAKALDAARREFDDIERRYAEAIGEERYAQFRSALEDLFELTRAEARTPAARDAALVSQPTQPTAPEVARASQQPALAARAIR